MKTFNEIPPEMHEKYCKKVLKYCLKNYGKLNSNIYPQSCVMRPEDIATNHLNGEIFDIKLEIDQVIETLPLQLKKIIIVSKILDLNSETTCMLLGLKYRVEENRKVDEAIHFMYEKLGPNWLRAEPFRFKQTRFNNER